VNISQPSSNFAYLAHHDARLVALATQAEEHFGTDPTVNRRVITEAFNGAVLGELANHTDPEQDEKTLIFCEPTSTPTWSSRCSRRHSRTNTDPSTTMRVRCNVLVAANWLEALGGPPTGVR
jgi:hypothetical protein